MILKESLRYDDPVLKLFQNNKTITVKEIHDEAEEFRFWAGIMKKLGMSEEEMDDIFSSALCADDVAEKVYRSIGDTEEYKLAFAESIGDPIILPDSDLALEESTPQRTITLSQLKDEIVNGVNFMTVKDNSPRGVKDIPTGDVKVGDEVVIDNYFVKVVADKSVSESADAAEKWYVYLNSPAGTECIGVYNTKEEADARAAEKEAQWQPGYCWHVEVTKKKQQERSYWD